MYKRIQDLCKAHNTTITALCTEVTGSPGNLATWKKGYMRSDYLLTVAEKLNCTTDYLLTGKNTEKSSLPELTENEQVIVKVFKELTDTQQGEIIGRAKAMAEQNDDLYLRKEDAS